MSTMLCNDVGRYEEELSSYRTALQQPMIQGYVIHVRLPHLHAAHKLCGLLSGRFVPSWKALLQFSLVFAMRYCG